MKEEGNSMTTITHFVETVQRIVEEEAEQLVVNWVKCRQILS